MSKRCQMNTKDVAMDRHRTQHVEEMSDEHKRCCDGHETGHNMSKEMSDEHKECCDGHETEHNMSKRCQMNTKDVAMDMRQNTTCRRDVRRTQKMLR